MDDATAKRLVRESYNQISRAYRDDIGTAAGTVYATWVAELSRRLNDGDRVLDLGCGNGIPVSRLLSERFKVTGLDISDVQIERARALVPSAEFHRADMTQADFPAASFAAIVSFFALIHVPVAEQPRLIQRISGWLRPQGLVLATLGHDAWTGTEEDWHGATMYWSQADADTYARWLDDAGLVVEKRTFVPEGNRGHSLFLVRRCG